MNIPIVIPTYKRSHLIISRTLNLLARLEYPQNNIFVVVGCNEEMDYWDYHNAITELYPNVNLLVGDNSDALASQLNFIRNELLEDKQLAIIMDDDIEDILVRQDGKRLATITKDQLEKFLCIAPNLMREFNVGLCGVNSTGNPFYMSDKVKLCKTCIGGFFQLFFNEPDINLKINQGCDAYESCYFLDKYENNIKFDFITIKTKFFNVGGLYDYRLDKKKTHQDYLYVAKSYPKYLEYYEWEEGSNKGIDSNGKEVKIPKSRQDKLTIELKWKRFSSKTLRVKEDVF
tara:strand:- start:69 stop:932 length:864 start_codon:yes stop_codon:yes gene_type:complete